MYIYTHTYCFVTWRIPNPNPKTQNISLDGDTRDGPGEVCGGVKQGPRGDTVWCEVWRRLKGEKHNMM